MREEGKGGEDVKDEGTKGTSEPAAQAGKKKGGKKGGKSGGKKEGNGKTSESAVKQPSLEVQVVEEVKKEEKPEVPIEAPAGSGKPQESAKPVQEPSTQEPAKPKNTEPVTSVAEAIQQPPVPAEAETSKIVIEGPVAVAATVPEVSEVITSPKEAKVTEVVPEPNLLVSQEQTGLPKATKDTEPPVTQIVQEEPLVEKPQVSATVPQVQHVPETVQKPESFPVQKEEERKKETIVTTNESSPHREQPETTIVQSETLSSEPLSLQSLPQGAHSDEPSQDQSSTVAQVDEREVVEEVVSNEVEVEVAVAFEPPDPQRAGDELKGTADLKPVDNPPVQTEGIQHSLEEAKKRENEHLAVQAVQTTEGKEQQEEAKKDELPIVMNRQRQIPESKPEPVSTGICSACSIL